MKTSKFICTSFLFFSVLVLPASAGGLNVKNFDGKRLALIYKTARIIIKGTEVSRELVNYSYNNKRVTHEEGQKLIEKDGDRAHILKARYRVIVRVERIIKGAPKMKEVSMTWLDSLHSSCPHIPDNELFREGIWCELPPTADPSLYTTEWILPEQEKLMIILGQKSMHNKSAHTNPLPAE